MHIQELWRYPVKSMRGERLTQADIQKAGIHGDRRIVVLSEAGSRLVTARTHPGLLGLQASYTATGEVTIEGFPWNSEEACKLTSKAAGERVQLVDAGVHPERFDVLPLLVATDGAAAELDVDMRRLRPNIVIGGVPGHAENLWPGHQLHSGDVSIQVAQRRMRCVMTTYDPDTLAQDIRVLRRIFRKADGKLALDCSVEHAGTLHIGDPVELAA